MRRAGRGGRSRWELGGRLNPAAGCSVDAGIIAYITPQYSILFCSIHLPAGLSVMVHRPLLATRGSTAQAQPVTYCHSLDPGTGKEAGF